MTLATARKDPSLPIGRSSPTLNEAVAVLDAYYAATGDARARQAVGILCGRKGGRPKEAADDQLVAEARWLFDTKQASSKTDAARRVAMTAARGRPASLTAIEKRIFRKAFRNKTI